MYGSRLASLACAGTYLESAKTRGGVGVNPGRSGSSRSICHSLGAAGVFGGGVAGAEPPHKGGPNRPDRPENRGERVEERDNCARLVRRRALNKA